MGYKIGYTGKEIDELLKRGHDASIIDNGWSKLECSDNNPVDLNTLVTPGNYSIAFWNNGPIQLNTNGPINVCVAKDIGNNILYQTIYNAGIAYNRTTDEEYFTNTWKEIQSESEMNSSDKAPINPEDNYSWINLTNEGPVISIYKEKTGKSYTVSPGGMSKASCYDPQGIHKDIDTYLNEKIEEADLESAEKVYTEHINKTDEVVNYKENISETSRAWRSVCYGKDKFVAIADSSNTFAYSTDGITWTEDSISETSRWWQSVCYGKDKFVVITYNSNIFAYSLDGINWTEGTISSTDRTWHSVCYGKDKFVAVINVSNIFAYSLDGINWTEGTISETSRAWRSVCYGKDKFVAVNNTSNIFAYSTDGITWNEITVGETNKDWYSVCYGKDKFVAVNSWSSNIFAYSYDGINWSEVTVGEIKRDWRSVCYGNNKFVAIRYHSNSFAYSYDGITWTESTISETDRRYMSVCYGKDKFVAVCYDSALFATIEFIKYPIHITNADKAKWNNGIEKEYAQNAINSLSNELTSYANDQIQSTTTNINELESTINDTKKTIDSHMNDELIHLTEEQVDSFNNKASGDHKHLNDNHVTVGSNNLTGLIDIERLDPRVIERCYMVDSYEEMMNLTSNKIQNGDSVYIKELNTEKPIVKEGNISETNREWRTICYGNDKYVTVTYGSNIFAYSTDGINWTEGTISETNRQWFTICYGNDKFITMENHSNIFAYSIDGINWTESTISETNRVWWSVCYGKDKFVAITSSYNTNTFAYSTDGITWTESTISETKYNCWTSICYGKDKFVAISMNSNTFAYSTDGITWTEGKVSETTRSWCSVCYGNDRFIAVADNSNIFTYSLDGINWIEVISSIKKHYWCSICYGNNIFVAVGYNFDDKNMKFIDGNDFAYSTDGITWIEERISETDRVWIYICYGKDKFVTIDEDSSAIATIQFIPVHEYPSAWFVIDDSKLGEETYNITIHNIGDESSSATIVCYGKDKFVALYCNSNRVFYSYDGITWTEGAISEIYTNYDSKYWQSVCYGKDKFVAVGGKSTRVYNDDVVTNIFAYSYDGINWIEGTIGTVDKYWESVCYGKDKFVVISEVSNKYAYSLDGITWTESTISESVTYLWSICYGKDKFVIVGEHSYYSLDGISWTELTNICGIDICYGKDKFVIVYRAQFAYSTDGINWTYKTFEETVMWGLVCYGNNKFIATDPGSPCFAYSYDGINWIIKRTTSNNEGWNSVCYGNDKFVFTAYNGLRNRFIGWIEFTPAGLIQYAKHNPEFTWGNISNKPKNISEYGITNCYTREEIDNLYNEIINSLNNTTTACEKANSEVSVKIPVTLDATYTANLKTATALNARLDKILQSMGLNEDQVNDIVDMYKNRSLLYQEVNS